MSFKPPGFYPVLDTALLARCGMRSAAAAEAILEAGAQILQFRHKDFFSRKTFEEAECIAGMCRAARVTFVMNDRADLAALLGSALHLGQDDLAPADARKVVPSGTAIGFSTHNRDQLLAGDSEPVDYLAIGPIFATGSKLNPDPVVGVSELRTLRAVSQKPLVAIGGVTRETARSVFEAGADSIAVIGDVYPNPLSARALKQRVEEWLAIASSYK
ncbi:MAG TPA: thiamine phosphate synthase [Bryobacteraceae bacterium]|nr:thiamine phosphate synthase [Bryobacteraceae bacterium]